MLSQVQVGTPLIDLLLIPIYAKFLKDILSNKRNLHLGKHVINKVCSAMILNKSPLEDLNSFVFTCVIERIYGFSAIVNFGSQLNLMSFQISKKLGLHGN